MDLHCLLENNTYTPYKVYNTSTGSLVDSDQDTEISDPNDDRYHSHGISNLELEEM
jgi:hypothetical protein